MGSSWSWQRILLDTALRGTPLLLFAGGLALFFGRRSCNRRQMICGMLSLAATALSFEQWELFRGIVYSYALSLSPIQFKLLVWLGPGLSTISIATGAFTKGWLRLAALVPAIIVLGLWIYFFYFNRGGI